MTAAETTVLAHLSAQAAATTQPHRYSTTQRFQCSASQWRQITEPSHCHHHLHPTGRTEVKITFREGKVGDHSRGSTPGKEILRVSTMGSPFSVSSSRCLNPSEACALDSHSGESNKHNIEKEIPSAALTSREIYLAVPFQVISWNFFSRLQDTDVLVRDTK